MIFLFIALGLFQLLGVPLLGGYWYLALIPTTLLSNSFWAAVHETIHGGPKWVGRVLSILFGSSYYFLSAAHLTHHALNRTEERIEIVGQDESLLKARIRYYFFLCGGLYLSEMMVPFAFIWPLKGLKDRFLSMMVTRASTKRFEVVLDSFLSIVALAVSFWLYGDSWYWLGLSLVGRAFLVSSLDYIYHYGNPVGDPSYSYNLKLPKIMSLMILRFNLHHAHHLAPKISWDKLPEPPSYDGSFFKAAARVWRGPVKGLDELK